MKKLSHDFTQQSTAQKAALEGLQTYAETLAVEREIALLRHDQQWTMDLKHLSAMPDFQLHPDYGHRVHRSIPHQYRHIEAAAYERRKQIVERFDNCARDIEWVKSKVMDSFNELSRERNFSPALPKRAFERAVRSRSNDRER